MDRLCACIARGVVVFTVVAAAAACASAPTVAPPTVVVNATTTLPVVAAGLAVPTPAVIAAYPYPYPRPVETPRPIRTRWRPTDAPLPTLTPEPSRTPPPPHGANDPVDEAAIRAVIERSYIVRAAASFSGDTTALDETYINHPSYPLTGERLRQFQGIRARVAGRVPPPDSPPGILDYWRAFYTYQLMDREQAVLLGGTATALANPTVNAAVRAANATLMAQQAQGTPVTLPPYPTAVPFRHFDPNWRPTLRYLDINVQGDHAVVHLDDGPYDIRLVLVKTAGGWRIADDVILQVHP